MHNFMRAITHIGCIGALKVDIIDGLDVVDWAIGLNRHSERCWYHSTLQRARGVELSVCRVNEGDRRGLDGI